MNGQLGASLIETNVAAQMRASATTARSQGNATLANQLETWAAQLESDPTAYQAQYQQPYYPPYYRPYYPFSPPFYNYPFYNLFHPIDSFMPFGSRITISSSTPGRVTNIR